jgi:sterol desaturase/sphingolipid hydroxylase (fatty acid hydroxylase superfamily)
LKEIWNPQNNCTMSYVKKEGQGKIFDQQWLELLTRTNPLIHIITYGGSAAFFLYLNHLTLSQTIMCMAIGAVVWSLVEYLIHRFLFHIKPSRFQYTIHGVHHEYPRDKERLMMPPVPGLMITLFFYALWWLFTGIHYAPACMAGFLAGYLFYTFVHYLIHAHKPIKPFTFFWAHHLKHHNPQFEHKAYGVSSPLWDWVFGTMPR